MKIHILLTLFLIVIPGLLIAEQPHPDGSHYVNDAGLKSVLEKRGAEFLDEGKLVKMSVIQKQLQNRKKADAANPETAPGTDVLTGAALFEKRKPSTLMIGLLYQCDHCDKWHGTIAGGVALSKDGLVVTNFHIMERDEEELGGFVAMTAEGKIYPVAEVVAGSEKNDLALIRIDIGEDELVPAPLHPGTDPVGTDIFVISHPGGNFYTLSEGIITRYYVDGKKKKNHKPRLSISADFAKGSSGSGIFNARGTLTALVASTRSIYYNTEKDEQKNLQMVIKTCIPASAIRELLGAESAD